MRAAGFTPAVFVFSGELKNPARQKSVEPVMEEAVEPKLEVVGEKPLPTFSSAVGHSPTYEASPFA